MYLMDIYEYETLAEMEAQEKIPLLGTDGTPYAYTNLQYTFAINANSSHIEGAWEFLAYMMSEEVQRTLQNPMAATNRAVCIETLEREVQWLKKGNIKEDGYGRRWSSEDITDDKVAEYISMRDRAEPGDDEEDRRMKPIWQIIWEESEAYFVGDKSIEEVADIINNRVQLYLDENR